MFLGNLISFCIINLLEKHILLLFLEWFVTQTFHSNKEVIRDSDANKIFLIKDCDNLNNIKFICPDADIRICSDT